MKLWLIVNITFYQDGKNVFKWAVTKMADVSAEIMERNIYNQKILLTSCLDQANLRIIDAVANRMVLTKDKDTKVLVNIDKYGNTSRLQFQF